MTTDIGPTANVSNFDNPTANVSNFDINSDIPGEQHDQGAEPLGSALVFVFFGITACTYAHTSLRTINLFITTLSVNLRWKK